MKARVAVIGGGNNCEHEVSLASAAAVEHRTLDDMAARGQLLLEPADEHAEVGIGGARIHLGDEKDSHA